MSSRTCITMFEYLQFRGSKDVGQDIVCERIRELADRNPTVCTAFELLSLYLDWLRVKETVRIANSKENQNRTYVSALLELKEKLKEFHPQLEQGADDHASRITGH
jgi:hypothetical protein